MAIEMFWIYLAFLDKRHCLLMYLKVTAWRIHLMKRNIVCKLVEIDHLLILVEPSVKRNLAA